MGELHAQPQLQKSPVTPPLHAQLRKSSCTIRAALTELCYDPCCTRCREGMDEMPSVSLGTLGRSLIVRSRLEKLEVLALVTPPAHKVVEPATAVVRQLRMKRAQIPHALRGTESLTGMRAVVKMSYLIWLTPCCREASEEGRCHHVQPHSDFDFHGDLGRVRVANGARTSHPTARTPAYSLHEAH